ncbi:hypothetical protein [Desulfitobacterium chlororespirans]|uniref:Uncharacterized protein n=1 Tax=Desulfitobacterium chlororespirans DSM 11544 TaxID=1121395 RepID=A0A1M7S3Q1_9FIRM|nr:hypothetical protein [Desulfitobacterium chlororespirans]SHN53076.1 hypothetical protein SAMN02745215_00484 [Desulfitobacterium chlororespirans DSM 11544]
MKEKEIRLTSEEIDYLLKGTIHWEDIASRTAGPLRKSVDPGTKEAESGDYLKKPSFKDIEQTKVPERGPFNSEGQGRNFNHNEKDRESFNFKEDTDEDFAEDFLAEDQPFWSGTKVYIILSLTGCITLGTWAYFVFA